MLVAINNQYKIDELKRYSTDAEVWFAKVSPYTEVS